MQLPWSQLRARQKHANVQSESPQLFISSWIFNRIQKGFSLALTTTQDGGLLSGRLRDALGVLECQFSIIRATPHIRVKDFHIITSAHNQDGEIKRFRNILTLDFHMFVIFACDYASLHKKYTLCIFVDKLTQIYYRWPFLMYFIGYTEIFNYSQLRWQKQESKTNPMNLSAL